MLDRWIGFVLLAGVVSSVLSIFVSDTFFCVAMLLWLVDCWKRKKVHLRFPPFFGFVLAFLLLVVGAVAFSDDVSISLPYLKRLIKYSYIFLIFTYVKPQWVEQALRAIFALLAGSSLYGILQYLWLMDVTLLNRIDGFMGHWMTFSGQLMLCSVALVGYLLFYRLPAMSSQGTGGAGDFSAGSGPDPNPKRLARNRWRAVLAAMDPSISLDGSRNGDSNSDFSGSARTLQAAALLRVRFLGYHHPDSYRVVPYRLEYHQGASLVGGWTTNGASNLPSVQRNR
jgi:hypothetical protein